MPGNELEFEVVCGRQVRWFEDGNTGRYLVARLNEPNGPVVLEISGGVGPEKIEIVPNAIEKGKAFIPRVVTDIRHTHSYRLGPVEE